MAFRIMKKWDYRAAQRPDTFVANSYTTQARIAEFYDRESVVVYPFLTQNNESFTIKNQSRDYFMCLGRIVPYKRFDIAIEACNALELPLKIYTSSHNSVTQELQKIS